MMISAEWTMFEINLLHTAAGQGATVLDCMEILPGRSRIAVQSKAHREGLRLAHLQRGPKHVEGVTDRARDPQALLERFFNTSSHDYSGRRWKGNSHEG